MNLPCPNSTRFKFMKVSFLTTLAVAALGLDATAASRSSASYSVPADSSDAGGRRTASINYSHHGCLGGFGGVGTVAAPPEFAKHGYLGQIYEVTTLVVSANPTNVNEGATRQLAARAILDDASVLNLAPARVGWNPVSGPINSISAGGLATTANVYQDTLATVQGRFSGALGTLGLLVRNTGTDDFGTYAGDGVNDAWQVQYFGVGNPNGGAGNDPDGDGQNNAYEYVVDSIPNDGTSFFRFRIEAVPGQATQRNLIFSPRVPGRIYTPQYTLDLATPAPAFNNLAGTATTDIGPTRTVTDLNATETNKFYRVHVEIP